MLLLNYYVLSFDILTVFITYKADSPTALYGTLFKITKFKGFATETTPSVLLYATVAISRPYMTSELVLICIRHIAFYHFSKIQGCTIMSFLQMLYNNDINVADVFLLNALLNRFLTSLAFLLHSVIQMIYYEKYFA